MPTLIEFKEIPIFRFLDAESRLNLSKIFLSHTRFEGDKILTFGKEVPGIFVIVDGEVVVTSPDGKQKLATLGRGQSFGEMSLIEQTEAASANVIVQSPEVKLLFGPAAGFRQLLTHLPACAAAFHQGASLLLSSRLRNLNTRINEEISQGYSLVTSLLQRSDVSQQLSVTRKEVNRTGDRVVSKLMTLMPLLDNLQQKYPTARGDLDQLRSQIEEVFLVDSQNFDRISQQLDLIVQHFENLQRVANGGQAIPLVGDLSLFSKAS